MATLILQAAGSAIGGVVGGPIGAMLGRALGSALGNTIDHQLFGKTVTRDGARLSDMPGLAASEATPIPRLYGRARLGGQLIWATRFHETVETHSSGGKGLGGQPNSETRTYSYYANLAIGLCEGPISYVRRIWADGKLIDATNFNIRIYRGDEIQTADPLIIAKEGIDNAPAYRGLAYIVFEYFPLVDYGNRVPQFSFEVVKAVDGVANSIRAINLIPGAGEFVYDDRQITALNAYGITDYVNRHQMMTLSDFDASLDQLMILCPNLETVQLVVTWFGNDLRAGFCQIKPRVEDQTKSTRESDWICAGHLRSDFDIVSHINGKSAYGGTPSDSSVIRAVRALKARGLRVIIYPFIMMDIPPDNTLPDPGVKGGVQPAYPWRGRITTERAIGRSDSTDATAQVDTECRNFFGTIPLSALSSTGETVVTTDLDEWSFRRLIYHYAILLAAENIDGIIIGSELRGLTRLRNSKQQFPAIDQLIAIADDVRAALGPAATVIYAADWSEYGSYVLPNGDVLFPLDRLFARPAISAVGIDAYWPLSDWRDGALHKDRQIAPSIYDTTYLASRFGAGEAYDWYYKNDTDRNAQSRAPISDGAFNEPWIYRSKDLVNWWSRPHYERVSGKKSAKSTAWVPQSKPIYLTEFGCPAVDRGSNAPNVFPDPKSSESELPFFSRGARDDLIQHRVIQAVYQRFSPDNPQFQDVNNPISTIYNGRMINPALIALWAWDARPFPAFPELQDVWSDGSNYQTGHWLNGRLESVPLDDLIAAILDDFDLPVADIDVDFMLDGYVIDQPMSARAALEPLAALYGFNCAASAGMMKFFGRNSRLLIALDDDDLLALHEHGYADVTHAQENELPRELRIGFSDSERLYRGAHVSSRRLAGGAKGSVNREAPIVLRMAEAQRLATLNLFDIWSARDSVKLRMRPGLRSLEPGDLLSLDAIGHRGVYRIERITDGVDRAIEARSVDPALDELPAPIMAQLQNADAPQFSGVPQVQLITMPPVTSTPFVLQAVAASASPWSGALAIWRSVEGATFSQFATIDRPARMGRISNAFGAGPVWIWDDANVMDIDMNGAPLLSQSEADAFAAKRALALQGEDGTWEIISYQTVELVGTNQYRVSHLLRGLGGTEALASRNVAAGQPVLVLDDALKPLLTGQDHVGETWAWRIVPVGANVSDPRAVEIIAPVDGLALKPLAPVHPTARRDASGIYMTWIRRARENADSWGMADIALDEADERYEIEILNGTQIVRTLSATTTSLLYSSDDELADFGSPQSQLALSIYQMSRIVGRGAPLQANLIIR